MSRKCPFRCMPNRKRHHWVWSVANASEKKSDDPNRTTKTHEFCSGCGGRRVWTTIYLGGFPKKQTVEHFQPNPPKHGWIA